ncbi:MAG: PhzF family phenazine biosynthesis protein [Myxococcaceae bacterium]
MELPLYQVDAFAAAAFAGNPAAVMPLDAWPDDPTLLAIAQENNLSETAFLVALPPGGPADYHLRWFTPALEVDLCGHGTVAAAHVLFRHLSHPRSEVSFQTRSGRLRVTRDGETLTLALPVREGAPEPLARELCDALRARPREVVMAHDLMAVFPSAAHVHAVRPDFEALCRLAPSGFIVTAPGLDCDFVSRYFAPREGVNEDPVTGSAHCTLVPYWAKRLGKTELRAKQISARGGELLCRLVGDEVLLSGRAVTYLRGTVFL